MGTYIAVIDKTQFIEKAIVKVVKKQIENLNP